jgi:Tol biopolymer transport system component
VVARRRRKTRRRADPAYSWRKAQQSHPILLPDGRKLLFDSMRSGILQIWQRDLTTGKETLIVTQAGSSPTGGFMPTSGRTAYRIRNPKRGGFDPYILDPATGESRKIFSDGYIRSINRSETPALARTPFDGPRQ